MPQSPVVNAAVSVDPQPSHPPFLLIDQIESILTSPGTFRTTTATSLLPLLERLQFCNYDDDGIQQRIVKIVKWCEQLDDAATAAHARETITAYLKEVISWPEWTYSTPAEVVEIRKERVHQIKWGLAELPVEWLKTRVTRTIPLVGLSWWGVDDRVTQTGRRITSPGIFNDTHYFLIITTSINSISTLTSLHSPLPSL
jgi:hypothetical protein